jgi:hypothetical protein
MASSAPTPIKSYPGVPVLGLDELRSHIEQLPQRRPAHSSVDTDCLIEELSVIKEDCETSDEDPDLYCPTPRSSPGRLTPSRVHYPP